jgi:hypothetical protein
MFTPPFDVGVQDTVTAESPPVTFRITGASGTPIGRTGIDAAEGTEVPILFTACTVKV